MAMKSIIKKLLSSKIQLGLSLVVLCLLGLVFINTNTVYAGGTDCNLVGGGTSGSPWSPAQLTVKFYDANGNNATAAIGYTLQTADGYPDIALFDDSGNWTGTSSNSVGSSTCSNANFDVWWFHVCGGEGNSCNGTYRGNGWALLCTQHPDGNPYGSSTGVAASFKVVGIQALPAWGGAGGGQPGRWVGFFSPDPGVGFNVTNGANTDVNFLWVPDPPPPPPPSPTIDIRINNSNSPAAINIGGTITVSWTSTNASSCQTAGGTWGSGAGKPTSNGGENHNSDSATSGTKTYTISCSGPGGSANDNVSIVVNVAPPTVSIGASPNPAEVNDVITVTWTSANASSCQSAGGVWGSGTPKATGTNQQEARPASDAASPGTITYTISCTNGITTDTKQVSLVVGAKPYLRVYGGDVIAGSGFGSCSSASSFISTFNKNGSSYGGGGAQFAVQATSAIKEFASASLRSSTGGSPSPNPATGLTFANVSNPPWGGSFTNNNTCAPDFITKAKATGDPTSGTYAGGNISDRQVLVHTIGDVTITGNVTFTGSPWSVSTIPAFYLIVKGNIYIDRGVTNLDGVYVAQDDGSGNKGKIYTCSNGATPVPANQLYTGNPANDCERTLTVNGSFIAQRVMFLRTGGTRNKAIDNEPNTNPNNNIAEVFNYGPALWLAPGAIPSSSSNYDSISSLPPVL
jgi:hypothetical protein